MGDEGAMSGTPEEPAAERSIAQALLPAGHRVGALTVGVTLLATALLIGAIVAALFFSGIFDTHEQSGANKEHGSGGGGPTPVPTSPTTVHTGGGQPTMTSSTTSTTTSTTTTPMPKILMCTTRYPAPINNPPDRLCDMVVYDADKMDLGDQPPDGVKIFVDYCKKGRTPCGLNIGVPDGVIQQLDKPKAKQAMQEFYDAGIRNYGSLHSEITASKVNDLKGVVDLLKKLQTFMNVVGEDRDTLFWGVSPLLGGATTPSDVMVQTFLDVLRSASINMVVYQTTFQKNGSTGQDGCISTGSAMWASAPLAWQPTFVDALNFWKAMKNHPLLAMKQMLAFTLCCFWAHFKKVQKAEFGLHDQCTGAFIGHLELLICPGSPFAYRYPKPSTLVRRSLQHMISNDEFVGGYDLDDTILQKMCMASVDYGYNGGWVVHSLQCHFTKFCGGQTAGGFQRVRRIKQSMHQKFQKCDYT